MAFGFRRQPDLGDDPLLAESLEACLQAEGVQPGSSAEAAQAAPAHLRLELQRLIEEARALRAAAQAPVPAPEFRDAARARLLARMVADTGRAASPHVTRVGEGWRSWLAWSRGGSAWLKAVAACLVALAIVSYGAISASAGALPGDPLYDLKLTRESVALRLEPSAVARASTLLDQADVRLEEVERLLQTQRLAQVAATIERYAAAVAEVTDALAAAPAADRSAALAQTQIRLGGQRTRLEALLRSAPPSAAASLQSALAAANQGLGQPAAGDAPATATLSPTVTPVLQSSPAASLVPPNRAPVASPIPSRSPRASLGSLSATPPPSGSAVPQRTTFEPAADTPQAEPTQPPVQR